MADDIASCIKGSNMFSWLMMLTVCLMIGMLMTFKTHSFSASSCAPPNYFDLGLHRDWSMGMKVSSPQLCSICVVNQLYDLGQLFYPSWT